MSSLLPDSLRDQDAPPRALVDALRQEAIEPACIERAYTRFLRQRAAAPTRSSGPRLVRHAALAVLMAVGTAYAATLIHPLTPRPQLTEARPPAEAQSPPLRTAPSRKAAVVLEQEASAEPELTPETEVSPEVPPAPPASVRGQAVRTPTPVPSAEQWKRAAQGLRDGDYQRADAALKELTRTGTEADRESALLVQAQVLLAQGRDAEAQSLLKSLEASARAPSVRRKSVELLARLRDRPPRSGKARVVTEAP
ncbi:MAG: hypothetical protein K0R38_3923 [Polyangiaceae bacterium]|nr:hypothetical protein [Polyangiaceae bacterium]